MQDLAKDSATAPFAGTPCGSRSPPLFDVDPRPPATGPHHWLNLISTNADNRLEPLYADGFHSDRDDWYRRQQAIGTAGGDFIYDIELIDSGPMEEIGQALTSGTSVLIITVAHGFLHRVDFNDPAPPKPNP